MLSQSQLILIKRVVVSVHVKGRTVVFWSVDQQRRVVNNKSETFSMVAAEKAKPTCVLAAFELTDDVMFWGALLLLLFSLFLLLLLLSRNTDVHPLVISLFSVCIQYYDCDSPSVPLPKDR